MAVVLSPFLIPRLWGTYLADITPHTLSLIILVVSQILTLITFIFIARLFIRRLHDIGHSGLLLLLLLVPIIGWVFLFYLIFKKGENRVNSYGPPASFRNPLIILGFKNINE